MIVSVPVDKIILMVEQATQSPLSPATADFLYDICVHVYVLHIPIYTDVEAIQKNTET